ncbi:MAG: diphthine synthase [Nitrososphaeria archaeon]
MTLVLVGMGVHGPRGIPVGALEDLRACGRVLLDAYTTPMDVERVLEELRSILGVEVTAAGRDLLEDAPRISREAAAGCLGIVVPGDVFTATTHDALRQEAVRRGVEVRVWHSSSVVTSALGRLGLHVYKLGFIGTLAEGPPQSAYRLYFGVASALRNGQHSLLLLQHDKEGGGLSVAEGLRLLRQAEDSWRLGAFSPDRVLIVASRLFSSSEAMRILRMEEALDADFGEHPHSIIVPGRLHYTEADSLRLILGAPDEVLSEAGRVPASLGSRLAESAIGKTRNALARFRSAVPASPGIGILMENVESYLYDAERFLREGNVELALAEAGYAEGLLDSLRLLGYARIDWRGPGARRAPEGASYAVNPEAIGSSGFRASLSTTVA